MVLSSHNLALTSGDPVWPLQNLDERNDFW